MERNKQNRPLNREEGFRIISEYFRSGMGCKEYYDSHGVSEWQFYKWKRLYLQEHPELRHTTKKPRGADSIPSFASLEIKDSPSSAPLTLPSIEIHYPNGIRLCIDEGLNGISCLGELLTLPVGKPCSR